jgi:hypothetical protein
MSLEVSSDNVDLLIKSRASAEILAKNVGEHLHRHYPGHLWAVNVGGGVVTVQNLSLSGKWGFRIFENEIDPDYKCVMRAGGELLERFNLRRGAARDEVSLLRRNLRGEAVDVDTST